MDLCCIERRIGLDKPEGVLPAAHLDIEREKELFLADLADELLGILHLLLAREIVDAHAEILGVGLGKTARQLHDFLGLAAVCEHLDCARKLACCGVHLRRSHELADFLEPLGLGEQEILDIDAGLLCKLLGFLVLAEHGEHVDCLFHLAALDIDARSILEAALVGVDVGEEDLGVAAGLFLGLDLVEQLNVARVSVADESAAGDGEVHVCERLHCKHAPVRVCDAKACGAVCVFKVLDLDEAVHARALRDIDGLHGEILETEDFGAAEADDKARELLDGRGEVACLDGEGAVPGEAEHVLHL
eukprot:comp22897_c0_seq1/m.58064 comp22897_c0_seq1/g.58064  ORF comp22897_c0_seq1/g.58064 comp22897_c0_seq1/m.58064 type:complete len:303 (-) comp22897_c0_seq1:469-1377(-)